jgi:hypothetical protein
MSSTFREERIYYLISLSHYIEIFSNTLLVCYPRAIAILFNMRHRLPSGGDYRWWFMKLTVLI